MNFAITLILWFNTLFWIYVWQVPAMAWFGLALQVFWLIIEVTEVFK